MEEIQNTASPDNDLGDISLEGEISLDTVDKTIPEEVASKSSEGENEESCTIAGLDDKVVEDPISEILEVAETAAAEASCEEIEKSLPEVELTEVDDINDAEKSEASSTAEAQISAETTDSVDFSEETRASEASKEKGMEEIDDGEFAVEAEEHISSEDKDKSEIPAETEERALSEEREEAESTQALESTQEIEGNQADEETQELDKPIEETDEIEEAEDSLLDKQNDDSSSKDPIEKSTDDDAADSSCADEIASSKSPDLENITESVEPAETDIDAKKSSDDGKLDFETTGIEVDSQNKQITIDKQIIEPENTEFVQITQDKQDDGQNEGPSIDAEDPFGADDLTSENVEPGENVDSPTDDEVNFHKLGDQAVNLQDVVNAKDTNFKDQTSREFTTEDNSTEDASENTADDTQADTTATDVNLESETIVEDSESAIKSKNDAEPNEKRSDDKVSLEPMSVDNVEETVDDENENDDDDGKKKDENEPAVIETEESQSSVLPGQDDELCIIPDSMKESAAPMVEVTVNAVDQSTDVEMLEPSMSKDQEETSQTNDIEIITEETVKTSETVETIVSVDNRKNQEKLVPKKKSTLAMMADIIDIDDEMRTSEIDDITSCADVCKQCNERKICDISVKVGSETYTVCSETCKAAFSGENNKAMDIPSDGVNSKREKRCAGCLLIVEDGDDRNLSWETMEFCNEECLGKFQTKYGSYCRNCNGSVQPISLGKYCVRFGYDVRQFCCSSCLEEFKKGLKVCSYCQKDISSGIEGFLAPVGDKGQFKDFCTQYCMEKYSRINSTEPPSAERKSCSVCQEVKVVHCEVQIDRATPVAICSDPCFAAFKFVNKVDPEQCSTCKKFFELANKKSFVVFYESEAHTFCGKTCLNIFIITNRKIVPCNWCKVKKYNFDMIKKDLKTGQALMMCSLNCLTLYQVSVNAVSAKRISCDFCKEFSQAQYHLTMSDATIRNFCSYNCVMKFQGQYTKSPITIPSSDDPVPTGMPKRTYPPAKGTLQTVQKPGEITAKKAMPVISSVTSLASLTSNGQVTQAPQPSNINNATVATTVATPPAPPPQVIVNQQVITRPPSPVKIHNKITQCKPLMHTKGVSVRPHPCPKETQTEGETRILIPIPVPIYVPFPMHMWSMPFPVPVPFPVPIPVPIFIPTTRNSAKGIMKDIKRIQEKIPADPFEAELLMMAEMVATEKKANESDSDSSDDNGADATETVDSSATFGEHMLQMALKMATGELDEPPVDLETALTPSTITATQPPPQTDSSISDVQPERNVTTSNRGRKRMVPYKPRGAPSKRGRRVPGVGDTPMMPPPESQVPAQPRMMEPIEKPDANMALKYTFGVNAWRQWVIAKNAELEKQVTPPRKVKFFKTDLLQLTADELNYTLCLFVKEVRKPNGAEYAPDTIYYLCLGIQQYLFENNRIDNIFTDSYYEKFTDCLNDVAKKFSVLYNDAQYIVTRVEEEHLWECKQLGAHSPHVLLSTLMFFNTKHFNLVTVEEHMQLSFSHIMKHWKRNPAATAAAVAGKGPGTRNVLLRFYPPQSALEANSRKKKVYEQQENEENPLRCPVKLYEFYLSKCPESVKTRNDVFYLLPERSCVPDSPVWYSTSALAKEHLVKMLYRVKMVKEINVALLTS